MKTKTVGAFAHITDDQGRILCVQLNYAERQWTTPGGGCEAGEDPRDTVVREVFEEAGLHVEVGELIGIYIALYKDDIVFLFEAHAKSFDLGSPNDENADLGWFLPKDLPSTITPNAQLRIHDGLEKRRGVLRILEQPGLVKS